MKGTNGQRAALRTYEALSEAASKIRHLLNVTLCDEAEPDMRETLQILEDIMDDLEEAHAPGRNNG